MLGFCPLQLSLDLLVQLFDLFKLIDKLSIFHLVHQHRVTACSPLQVPDKQDLLR